MFSRLSGLLSLLLLIPTWLLPLWQTDLILFLLSIWGNILEFALVQKAQVITGFMPTKWEVVNTWLLNCIDLNRTPWDAISIMTGKRRFVVIIQHLRITYYILVCCERESKANNVCDLQKLPILQWRRVRNTAFLPKCTAIMNDSRANYHPAPDNIIDKFQSMFQAKAVLSELDQLYLPGRVVMCINFYLSLSIMLAIY